MINAGLSRFNNDASGLVPLQESYKHYVMSEMNTGAALEGNQHTCVFRV